MDYHDYDQMIDTSYDDADELNQFIYQRDDFNRIKSRGIVFGLIGGAVAALLTILSFYILPDLSDVIMKYMPKSIRTVGSMIVSSARGLQILGIVFTELVLMLVNLLVFSLFYFERTYPIRVYHSRLTFTTGWSRFVLTTIMCGLVILSAHIGIRHFINPTTVFLFELNNIIVTIILYTRFRARL